MKGRACLHVLMGVVILLAGLCGYPNTGYSQSKAIDHIRFIPQMPEPGKPLKLSVALGSVKEEPQEIAIRLITWTDKNRDCLYQTDEETHHPTIRIKDNDPRQDEVARSHEMLVQLYTVPYEQAPDRYTVIVMCHHEAVSTALNVPPTPASSCTAATAPTDPGWKHIANRLGGLAEILKASGRENFEGAPNLYVYTLPTKHLERLTQSDARRYLSPRWSFDGQRIACVVNQQGVKQIAWLELKEKSLNIVTDGPADVHPFWLPDNQHLLFLRDQELQMVQIKNRRIWNPVKGLQVSQILAVFQSPEGHVQIIYAAPKQLTYRGFTLLTPQAFYLLELDQRLRFVKQSIKEFVSYLNWLPARIISPDGAQLLYSHNVSGQKSDSAANKLMIETVKGEQTQVLADAYNDYDPAWSPDGTQIVFVSDRP